MENPLQQREVKTTGASQQNFTTSGVFTNAVGNPNDAINPTKTQIKEKVLEIKHWVISQECFSLTPLS
jgi:hypothetical protein